jgi:hypothetical protein
MLVASEEATAGSVIAKHERISPRSRGSSHSLLVFVGAVALQHLHVAGVGGVAVEDLGRQQRAAHDLAQMAVFDIAEPGAAVGFGQEEVPQPGLARLRLQLLDDRVDLEGAQLLGLAEIAGLVG